MVLLYHYLDSGIFSRFTFKIFSICVGLCIQHLTLVFMLASVNTTLLQYLCCAMHADISIYVGLCMLTSVFMLVCACLLQYYVGLCMLTSAFMLGCACLLQYLCWVVYADISICVVPCMLTSVFVVHYACWYQYLCWVVHADISIYVGLCMLTSVFVLSFACWHQYLCWAVHAYFSIMLGCTCLFQYYVGLCMLTSVLCSAVHALSFLDICARLCMLTSVFVLGCACLLQYYVGLCMHYLSSIYVLVCACLLQYLCWVVHALSYSATVVSSVNIVSDSISSTLRWHPTVPFPL